MNSLPICDICQDKEKPSLSKIPGEGWRCDECIANKEHYDAFASDVKECAQKQPKPTAEC